MEAGFGRGKTFFRKAWAQQLRDAGENVVEVDVQLSDHSGDPIVTLLGALVDAIPKKDASSAQKAFASAKHIAALGAKSATRIVLRSAADEVIDAFTDSATDALGDFDHLNDVIQDFGDSLSKAAGNLIASQMAAEKIRKIELPEHIQTLRTAICEGSDSEQVVVIIDELDRCHPDYALAFLEATKLIFSQSGFVFCLMVNTEHLENLANHRFGQTEGDEAYLEKFVDIRLKLEPSKEALASAVSQLVHKLPAKRLFSEQAAFSLESAAKLAVNLTQKTGIGMRKIERILLRVEMALRCYPDQYFDIPLLIYLAFENTLDSKISTDDLPRASLTPERAQNFLLDRSLASENPLSERPESQMMRVIRDDFPELLEIPRERFKFPDDRDYFDWAKVFAFLAPHYIPSHQHALNAVAELLVEAE
ncbi:KAP family P-loop NTPase fold protein [Thalassococcus halodurans]|uniref:KAP family P-loop NTPase fold protein n=1 Tax=Thalassococcus halodurans TaxID=373675 RepID=UPI001F2520CE|nr:P-loop NTPase fold protein [Thalassococcus halodurans]